MTTQYTLLDPITGRCGTLSKTLLTRNLQLNAILLEDGEHVGIITHRDLVSFCRWCADQVLARCQTVPPEAHAALDLVDKWLEDPDSVSNEELNAAAEAAWAVDTNAEVARVAWAAADAAEAAAHATAAAAEIADYAEVSYEAQAQWLVEHLRSAQ